MAEFIGLLSPLLQVLMGALKLPQFVPPSSPEAEAARAKIEQIFKQHTTAKYEEKDTDEEVEVEEEKDSDDDSSDEN